MRRIIQISGYRALCDDGTMWACLNGVIWERYPDIPQDKQPENKITFEKQMERNEK